MSIQISKDEFKGQDFYIGIDTHLKQWTVAIRANWLELVRFSMNPSPEELHRYMNKHYPGGNYHSVYEAGFCGYWPHRRLIEFGFDNMVVNAADVPTSHKEKDQKRDKIDARKLARELEKRSLVRIYIPDEYHQHLRSLVRNRYKLIQEQTRIQNRISALFHFNGIKIPGDDEISHWSRAFITWIGSQELSHAPGQECLKSYLRQLDFVRNELLTVTRTLRSLIRTGPGKDIVFKYLMSAPGIGFIMGSTLYAELIDIHRFSNFDQLASMVGLIPSVHSSDEKEGERGMTHRANAYLRAMFIEAAWVAARRDPAMTLAFNTLCKRMKRKDAIIRIAKKLLSRVRYVWYNEKPYSCGIIQ